jgi:predicted unusual protein kinase regulating ubiquinone biosynthesis (AarF/ABC1/UbiB family)
MTALCRPAALDPDLVQQVWAEQAQATQLDVQRALRVSAADFAHLIGSPPSDAARAAHLHTRPRLGDFVRRQGLLWLGTAFRAEERQARSRSLLFGFSGWPRAFQPRAVAIGIESLDLYTGYTSLRARARQAAGTVGPGDWQLQHERAAASALATALALGGVLIKACQFASVRPDLLPGEFIRAFAQLQDHLAPRPWPLMRRVLEGELGQPLAQAFTSINPRAIAAASLAQVFAAQLRDQPVAVKVQYPEVARLVSSDLVVLQRVVDFVADVEPAVRLQPIMDHLRATLPLELDFRREGEAMTRLRSELAHRSDVVVPRVHPRYSTPRLLVADFEVGVKITDRAGLQAQGIDPSAVARLLVEVYAEQLLQIGFLHADPHPGNLLVQPGPRLVLLDHGMTMALDANVPPALRRITRGLADGDPQQIVSGMRLAGAVVPEVDDPFAFLTLFAALTNASSQPDLVSVGRDIAATVGSLSPQLIMVGRALGLIDGIVQQLDPTIDVLDIIRQYADD